MIFNRPVKSGYSPLEGMQLWEETQADKRKRKTPPCFKCGRHLRGNHSKLLRNTEDGIERTFHKSCATEELKENSSLWETS